MLRKMTKAAARLDDDGRIRFLGASEARADRRQCERAP